MPTGFEYHRLGRERIPGTPIALVLTDSPIEILLRAHKKLHEFVGENNKQTYAVHNLGDIFLANEPVITKYINEFKRAGFEFFQDWERNGEYEQRLMEIAKYGRVYIVDLAKDVRHAEEGKDYEIVYSGSLKFDLVPVLH